ncbi:T9SS type A sorting domain-containing protein [Aequorivita viscosa]|uniref:Por secretion system C-terminal sorting domain-containing protein n=1 Tax=Aequorivita viscosa TaxID=797419 RepID=A0A1M6ERP8_9FLAO|nr:T9SS type A sorting domain-containing protein [Aequorivita viscosa]SDW04651.1 Por secretion system C-terminal sorting domain-containing protein [Aequorivita viscosa]SHI88152.1 Por secretion system C-terminal sorting domain-containing protein [Aequorivita viscosa]
MVTCDTVYTADLVPNAGYWTNYTDVPYNYTGSEQVFEFTATATGLHIMDLDQGDGDADFMIMYSCGNMAGNVTNFYWTGEQSEYIDLVEGTTYYIIADLYETSGPTTVSIKVNCLGNVVVPEPYFDCFQGLGIAPSIDAAFNLDPLDVNTFVANGFTVAADTAFELQQISISTNQVQVPDQGVFNIRENNNGIPGAVIEVIQADVTSSIAYASLFNDPVYHVVFDLTETVVFTEGIYWLEPKITTPEPSTVWWAATENGTDGAITMLSEDGGPSWTPLGAESIFFVAGECRTLGISDLTSVNFNYYPNPVDEVFTIQSKTAIESISVYNLMGQVVLKPSAISHGEIDLSTLNSGIYLVKVTFDGGYSETLKIVKK